MSDIQPEYFLRDIALVKNIVSTPELPQTIGIAAPELLEESTKQAALR
jgi:hypothetical protein